MTTGSLCTKVQGEMKVRYDKCSVNGCFAVGDCVGLTSCS